MLSSEQRKYEDKIKALKAASDCRAAFIIRSCSRVVNDDKYLSKEDKERLCEALWKLYSESKGEQDE